MVALNPLHHLSNNRDNGRLQLESVELASAIWQRVQPFVPQTLPNGSKAFGCSSNIRLYKYCVGQRFGKHIDQSNTDPKTGATSEYTLLLYLNSSSSSSSGGGVRKAAGSDSDDDDILIGGDTVFYKGCYGNKVAARVAPQQGMCLVHGHGDRCLTHEGEAVAVGVKYLLRTDVMYIK
jgi:2OG-Fe(II) oxygenase superfamily